MSATLVVRHQVDDYAAWREVYDELEPLRVRHGCTGQRAWQLDGNPNDVLITHDFPTGEGGGGGGGAAAGRNLHCCLSDTGARRGGAAALPRPCSARSGWTLTLTLS